MAMCSILWSRLCPEVGSALASIGAGAAIAALFGNDVRCAGQRLHAATGSRSAAQLKVLARIGAIRRVRWEDLAECSVDDLRAAELDELAAYLHRAGLLMVFVASWRCLVIASLWGSGVAEVSAPVEFGERGVATVFVCMQILACLKFSCDGLARSLSRLAQVLPAIQRVESFLRLPDASAAVLQESPVLAVLPTVACGPPAPSVVTAVHSLVAAPSPTPTPVTSWAAAALSDEADGAIGDYHGAGIDPGTDSFADANSRHRSTFRWHDACPADLPASAAVDLSVPPACAEHVSTPVLTSVHLDSQHGKLMAVVGSGRSALVQTVEALRVDGPEARVCALPTGDRMLIIGCGSQTGDGCTTVSGEKIRSVAQGELADFVLSSVQNERVIRPSDCAVSAVHKPTAWSGPLVLLHKPLTDDISWLVAVQPDPALLACFERVILLEAAELRAYGRLEKVSRSELFGRLTSAGVAAKASSLPLVFPPLAPQVTTPLPKVAPSTRQHTRSGGNVARAPIPIMSVSTACRDNDFRKVLPWGNARHGSSCFRRSSHGRCGPLRILEARLLDAEQKLKCKWDMVLRVCAMGSWGNLTCSVGLHLVQCCAYLMCDLNIAFWTNTISATEDVDTALGSRFLWFYGTWLSTGVATGLLSWSFGVRFSTQASREMHHAAFRRILHSPYSQLRNQEVLRPIVSHFAADMTVFDLFFLKRGTGMLTCACAISVHMLYLHAILPLFVTLLALPAYVLLFRLCGRYVEVAEVLRDRAVHAATEVNDHFAQVRIEPQLAMLTDKQMASGFLEEDLCGQVTNRIVILLSCCSAAAYLSALANVHGVGVGTLGLALTTMLVLALLVEPTLKFLTEVQADVEAMERINGCLNAAKEIQYGSSSEVWSS
eukprot:TRINITY_DN29287_c0_g2_i1.p1 TRINITY_DN29287_c0_g2~~TRINITY_DN29287_c0_g2_i1.p1  ORF type:complete len:1032 (+),score=147.30 TRINITY_DN29287_c0_g2_i1:433-3096(+)